MKCIKFKVNGKEYQVRGEKAEQVAKSFKDSLELIKQQLLDKKIGELVAESPTGQSVTIPISSLNQIEFIKPEIKQQEVPNVEATVETISVDELINRFVGSAAIQKEVFVDINTLVDNKINDIKNGVIGNRLNFGEVGITIKSFNKNKVDIIEHNEEGDSPKTITLTKLKTFVKRVIEDEIEFKNFQNQTNQPQQTETQQVNPIEQLKSIDLKSLKENDTIPINNIDYKIIKLIPYVDGGTDINRIILLNTQTNEQFGVNRDVLERIINVSDTQKQNLLDSLNEPGLNEYYDLSLKVYDTIANYKNTAKEEFKKLRNSISNDPKFKEYTNKAKHDIIITYDEEFIKFFKKYKNIVDKQSDKIKQLESLKEQSEQYDKDIKIKELINKLRDVAWGLQISNNEEDKRLAGFIKSDVSFLNISQLGGDPLTDLEIAENVERLKLRKQLLNQTQPIQQTSIKQLLNNPSFIDFVKSTNFKTDNPELDAKIKEIRSTVITNKADEEIVVVTNPINNEVEEVIEEVEANVEEVIPVEHDGNIPSQSLTQFIDTLPESDTKKYLEVFTQYFPNVQIQYKTGLEVQGEFSLSNPDLITVNAEAKNKDEIVLHEVIHKATIIDYLLNRNSESSIAFDNLFKEFINAVKGNKKAEYELFKKNRGNGIKEIDDFINSTNPSDEIQVKAVAEFIAYGMSDLNFKKLLNSIKSSAQTPKSKDKSLYEQLKSIIKTVFEKFTKSFPKFQSDTILDKLIDNVAFVLNKEDFAVGELSNEWKDIVLNKDKPEIDKIPSYLNFGARKTWKNYTDNLKRIESVMTEKQYKWFKHSVSYANLVVNDTSINELEQGDMIKVPQYEAVKDKKGNVTEFKTKLDENSVLKTRWEVVVKKYGNMIATIDEYGNTRTRIIKRGDEYEIKEIKKFVQPFNKSNVELSKFYNDNHTSYKETNSTFIAGDGVKVTKGATVSYNTNLKMDNGNDYIGGGVVTANYGNMVEIVVKGKDKYFTKLIPTNTIRNVYFRKDTMSELIKNKKDKSAINLNATKLDISGVSLDKTNIAYKKEGDNFIERTGQEYASELDKHWNKLEAGDMVIVKTDIDGAKQFPATIVAKTTAKGREGIMINHKGSNTKTQGLLEFISKESLLKGESRFKILSYYENPFEISEVYSTFNQRFNKETKLNKEGKEYRTDDLNRNYDIYDFGLTSDNKIANEKYENINNKSMLKKAKQGDIIRVEFNSGNEKKTKYEVLLEVTDEYYMTVKEARVDGVDKFIKSKYYKNNPEHIAKIKGVGFVRQIDNYLDDMIELLPLLKTDYIKNPLFEQRLSKKYTVVDGEIKHENKRYADKQPFKTTHFDSSSITNGGSVVDKYGKQKKGVRISNAEKFFASRGDIAMVNINGENRLGLIVHNRNNKMILATNIKDKNNNDVKLENMNEEQLVDVFNKLDKGEYSVITYDKKYDEVLTVYFRNYKYSPEFIEKLKAASLIEKQSGVVKLNYSNPKSASIKAAKRFGLNESLDNYTARNVIKAKYSISDLEYSKLNVRDEILKIYPLADLNELSDDDLHFLNVGALEQLEKTNWYSDLINRNSIPLLDLQFETEQDLYDYLEKRDVTSHIQLKNFIEKQRVKSTYNQLIEQGLLTMYC